MRIARFLIGATLFLACSKDDEPSPTIDASPDASATDDAHVVELVDAGVDAIEAAIGDADAGFDAAAAIDAGPPIKGYTVLGEISFAFTKPYALAVDSTDHLYVSEQTDDPDTHTLYLTNRSFATNVATGHARILKFDGAGAYLGWIGAGSDNSYGLHAANSTATAVYGDYPGQFMGIRGLATDASDHLFVLDGRRIQELDAAHAFVRWAGYLYPDGYGWHMTGYPDPKLGPAIGGFTWASGIRLHAGKMWVGTWYWNGGGFTNGDWNCISALDLTTGLGVGWLGGAKNTTTNAESTGYFAVDAGYAPRASIVHSSSPGAFSSPRQFVWRNNLVYVVDNTSDPVLSIFDETGVMQPGKLVHLAGTGEKPFAIAVDKFGNVIVSDMYTGSVRFFSTKLDANGELTQVAEWQLDTPSTPNAFYPLISDFAWNAAEDVLYVSATTKNKVYKIALTY